MQREREIQETDKDIERTSKSGNVKRYREEEKTVPMVLFCFVLYRR